MPVIELGRRRLDDVHTIVTVAVGADRQVQVTVLTEMVDGPGYTDMLARMVADQVALKARHERGMQL